MKGLLVGVALVVLLVAGLVFYVDRIARDAIERGGSDALGVATEVGSLTIGLVSGRFSVGDLEVANPAGFQSEHFLRLDRGNIALRIRQLLVNPVTVSRIELSGIDVHLERKGTSTNYGQIFDNLASLESDEAAQRQRAGAERGFVIREILIRDVTAHVQLAPEAGKSTKLDVEVPEIRLEEVGDGGAGGARMTEVASILTRAVLRAIAEKGGGLPSSLSGELRLGLGRLDRISGTVPVVGSGAKGLGDKAKGSSDAD